MSPARWRALAAASLATAWLAEPASAQPPRERIFLPTVGHGGSLPLPCMPVDGGPCPGTAGWRLVCGGFGALRDLVAWPGSATAMGIGEGVARLRIAAAPGAAPLPGEWWFEGQLQVPDGDYDRVLNGLRGVGVARCPVGDPRCPAVEAWSVGDRPWVASYDEGCWRPDAPIVRPDGRRALEGEARLRSLVPSSGGALAVGERAGIAAHAVPIQRAGGWAWLLSPASAGAGLPPLFDVDVLGGPIDADAWAVGRDGLVARMRLSANVWETAARLTGGTARELTMLGSAAGWAFGMGVGASGTADTIVWRYDGTSWVQDARYPDQVLIDAYKYVAGLNTTILLGLRPGGDAAPDATVLHLRSTSGGWRALANAPPGATGANDGGNMAIAPLMNDPLDDPTDPRVLYAAGNDIWLFDPQLASPTERWNLLRRRLDLVSVVPYGAGAWVLAAVSGGSRLLEVDAAGRLVDPEGDASDLPPLRAMAGGPELWAVGDAGATWRRTPTRGTWEQVVPAGTLGVDLADVARDDAGGLWSAGGTEGSGRLLRWDEAASGWQAVATAEAPLRAVAALSGGGAVAVGGRAIVTVQPGERCRDGGAETVISGDRSWCVATLAPCFSGTCLDDLSAVASAPDALWVANPTYVLRQRAGGSLTRWRESDWDPVIPSVQGMLKPQEAPISALAVSGRDDGWAVFGCCSRRDAPGHETSYAVRFAGSEWTEAMGVSVPVRDAAMDEGTLWLAGDWSTLATRGPR